MARHSHLPEGNRLIGLLHIEGVCRRRRRRVLPAMAADRVEKEMTNE